MAFTHVQIVTFTEWRRPQPNHYGLQDRIEALAGKLERAGVQAGDTVVIGTLEFEYEEGGW